MSQGGLLISGALVIQLGHLAGAVSTPALVREEHRWRGVGWLGTLLGPEGTGACCLGPLGWAGVTSYFLGHASARSVWRGVCSGVRGGLGAGTDRILRTA
jgi:hypothetical protein